MKQIRPGYPTRKSMLAAPFKPLSDAAFRQHVASGAAIPAMVGGSLFVAKWRDKNRVDPETFLANLDRLEMKMVVREFANDVNIRVIKR